jgi:dTDP-4-dehydrorhamnose 3,5-epimerase-like enzyme
MQEKNSSKGKSVLRDLCNKIEQPQGKLVQTTLPEVFDVAVDIRKVISVLSHWGGIELAKEKHKKSKMPTGLKHNFFSDQ